MTKVAKKKARRLGRTIRKTLGTLFLISALVVAAIPVDYLQAEGEDAVADTGAEDGIMAMARPENDKKITLGLNKDDPTAFPYRSNIPDIPFGADVTPEQIYSTGDGQFQFAYVRSTGGGDTMIAVILGYDKEGPLDGGRLVIPDMVDAYRRFFANTTSTNYSYVAVNKQDNFLYYEVLVDAVDENGNVIYVQAVDETGKPLVDEEGNPVYQKDPDGNPVTQKVSSYRPCYYDDYAQWKDIANDQLYYISGEITDSEGNKVPTYARTATEPEQRIYNAAVRYIGNQYLEAKTGQGESGWTVKGDVTSPENGIFAGAGNIQTLVVGQNLSGIGNYAFAGCSALSSIELANGLNTIGNYAFYNCVNMTDVNIDAIANISIIGERAFNNCRSLQRFTVPIKVERIGDSAFENCEKMTEIDLTAGGKEVMLTELGYDVFKGCRSLQGITFPQVFSNNNSDLDISTFQGCISLKYIATGTGAITENGVRDEGNGDFNLNDSETDYKWSNFKAEMPQGFYLKGPEVAKLHTTATTQEIPYSYYDRNLSEYVYELTVGTGSNKVIYRVTEEGRLVACEMTGMNTVDIPLVIGPNDVKSIAERTFQDNCALKKITIPESINGIEQNAFKGCHNLEDVIFVNPPEGMTIGAGAFKTQQKVGTNHIIDCSNPGYLEIPAGENKPKSPILNFVGPISSTAAPFEYAMTPGENINAGEQDQTYITYQSGWPANLEVRYNPATDKNELVDYPTVKELAEGLKYYAKNYLGGNSSGGYAYMTKSYEEAAKSAASKYIASGENAELTEDESNVLSAALNLVLPDGIEAIGTRVTPQSDGTNKVEGLFEYKEANDEMATGTLGDGTGLRKTITAEGIEEVQDNAFKKCKYLKGITFSDKTTSIGNHAFEDCDVLQDVSIPATVSKMGLSPFRGCDILSDVNFNESPYFSCEKSVIFELGEEGVHTALVEYLNGKVPHIVNSEDVEGITSIYPEAFMNSNIESADLSTATLEEIPVSAFQGTERLFSVTLPNGCRRVNENAFADSNIRQLVVPSTVNVINDRAFAHIDTQNPEYAALTFYCQEGTVAEDYAKSYGINISYKLPEYEVRLYDEEGNLAKSIYVEQGQPLEIPEDLENLPPTKGYTRLTWTPPAGTIITGLTNVYASYVPMEPSEYQKVVNFIAFDKETILSTQTVTPGENAVPPQAPEEAGYEFTGWFGEQIGEDMLVTDEMESPVNIYAQYEKIDSLANTHTVTFLDYDNTFLYTQSVEHGKDASAPRTPSREGYTFKEWLPYPVNVTEDMTVVAQYTSNNSGSTNPSGSPNPGTSGSPSPSPSPGTSGSSSPSPTPGGNGGNTGSGNETLYTLTVRNGSGSGQYAAGSQIIVVADEPGRSMEFDGWTVSPSATSVTDKKLSAMAITMPANDVAVIANYKSRTTGTGNTSTTNTNRPTGTSGTVNRGGTTVVIDKNGLSNTGVVSATVNGSSDNFTIKITESSEATEAVLRALQAEYGNLENVKYFPMDISLYDSTGNNKITDTTGLSVSITLPLPDSLITYAGNNKVAGVVNDKLDKLTPRFTTINGVSCITFTAEHFSPYVIYVDITNLSDGTITDNTPTTGDGIHPKWFLSIGLACLSFVMFTMKDSRKKQKVKVRA